MRGLIPCCLLLLQKVRPGAGNPVEDGTPDEYAVVFSDPFFTAPSLQNRVFAEKGSIYYLAPDPDVPGGC
ncbi:hypothetical protein CK934_17850 [Chitinophaga sp. MD30]|nr:hypothetical protein CK934_17850 [Chitinophaga sp. MD30]